MDFGIRNLDQYQLQNFKKLKQIITEQHGTEEARDEARLLRFLIARDFDVDKSSTMLNNHIIWRHKHGIDDLLYSYKPPEVLDKYLPIVHFAHSHSGDLVAFIDFGSLDMIGFGKSVSKSDFTLYITYTLEGFCQKLKKKSEKDGKSYQSWILIFDFEKGSLSQVTNKDGMDLLITLMPIYEANYPEMLKAAYVINASLAFTVVYAVLKPLLFERTRNKVKVFGKSGWKEELCSIIHPEVITAFFGGEFTYPDGDRHSASFIRRGDVVPPKYYFISKSQKNLSSKPGVRKYVVPRFSRVNVTVDVGKPGSQIEWEFQTENYEIGFGMTYVRVSTDGTKETENVLPVEKVDTRVFCETGLYHCERPGTYALVFDNSFSWLRSKEVYVRAYVVQPDGRKTSVV